MDEILALKGKVCLITGAGKGFGREIAIKFANQGCKLALISRSKGDLESLEQELCNLNIELMWHAGDVSKPDVVKTFVDEVISKFGKIDILINNAGIRFRKSFLDCTYKEWKYVQEVNLGSTFLFCQEVGRHMVKQEAGKIINMASIVGTLALADLSAYGASKAGIVNLTKTLALEWAEKNINVNVLAPGFCETSYTESFKQKTALYDFTLERTPMKKWGNSEDIANACLFLASDMSTYITGEVLNIDGGWSAW